MSVNKLPTTDSTYFDQAKWSMVNHTAKPDLATDYHLQSLGLDVDDGLPKFRLNEPGPAALASSIFQQNNMVNDETEQSFVVLSKTSLESIREASMSSYMELQEKCASADLSISISMMSPSEIEDSLKKVLEENIKLKETLKQNNTAIKEQFNTITTWQKEVMTVCDTHKQKFLETKELMNQLKKQNDELRKKIAENQSQESSAINNIADISIEKANESLLSKRSNYVDIENISSFPNSDASYIELNMEQSSKIQLENMQELQRNFNTVSEELAQKKIKHSETHKKVENMEKPHYIDIELLNQQLNEANDEFYTHQKSNRIDSSGMQILVNKCCEKDMELKYLNEIITSLKQQLIKYEENIFSPIDIPTETSDKFSEDKKVLKENYDFYNLKLAELRKCFSSQSSQYLRIQQFLKESVDIIQIFENVNIISNEELTEEKIVELKEKLHNYRENLIDEQLYSIDNKQITIKVQKQFQKILSDYSLIICELEIVKNENLKLNTMQEKAAGEISQKMIEIEKYLNEEKKYLDSERANLLEERLNLNMEKKLLIEEKDKIDIERKSMALEKLNFAEERASLREERTSLDQQSKLYEAEESILQTEKKRLQEEVEAYKHLLHMKDIEATTARTTLDTLLAGNSKLKENEEMLSAYRIQTEMREKEFEDMRITQRNLQDQLQSLSLVNMQLRSENERITNGQYQANPSHLSSRYCNLCTKYYIPGKHHGLGICSMQSD